MAAVFLKLLNMSITASWLILAVIVLRIFLKKAPKAIWFLLWLFVGVRLLVPIPWESVTSLIPSAKTVRPDILYADVPKIHSGLTTFNQMINPVISDQFSPAVGDSVNPIQITTTLASYVWIMGLIALLLFGVLSYIRLRLQISDAVLLRDKIWQSEKIDSPFVLGLLRPRIYVPYNLDESIMRNVVIHEQAHISHHDHWIKPFGFLLLAVYWFNPLVWLAYVLLCRDIELACDERVIKELGIQERKAYSNALLSCSIPHHQITACPLAFGEVGVKSRIKSVLNYKKPAFWIVVLALLSCLVLALCFMTNPKDDTSFLNYENLALLAQESNKLPVHLSSKAMVQDLTIDGNLLADFLQRRNWALQRFGRQIQRRAEKSTASIEINFDDQVWLSVFDTDTARIYFNGQIRYYQTASGDYAVFRQLLGESIVNPFIVEATYAFKNCIYMNSLSSYYPFLDTGYLYQVDRSSLEMINTETGKTTEKFDLETQQFYSLTEEEWASWFQEDWRIPDIKHYREKYWITLSDDDRILLMDGEVWLVHLNGGHVWSVYSLIPQFENYLTLHKLLLLVQSGDQLAWSHLRPYVHSDIGSGLYVYAFPIDEHWRFLLSSTDDFSYDEKLSYVHMTLEYLPDGDSVRVHEQDVTAFIAEKESVRTGIPTVFSGYSYCPMVAYGSDSSQNLIRIDTSHRETYGVPFSVYIDGKEISGAFYEVIDVETGEKLEFLMPSGLAAQTYLLHDTEPGRVYLITINATDDDLEGPSAYSFRIIRP